MKEKHWWCDIFKFVPGVCAPVTFHSAAAARKKNTFVHCIKFIHIDGHSKHKSPILFFSIGWTPIECFWNQVLMHPWDGPKTANLKSSRPQIFSTTSLLSERWRGRWWQKGLRGYSECNFCSLHLWITSLFQTLAHETQLSFVPLH